MDQQPNMQFWFGQAEVLIACTQSAIRFDAFNSTGRPAPSASTAGRPKRGERTSARDVVNVLFSKLIDRKSKGEASNDGELCQVFTCGCIVH